MLTTFKRKKPMKRDLMMIHGAWSSGLAFHHLTMRLKDHPNVGVIHTPTYNIQNQSMARVVDNLRHVLEHSIERPAVVVGHSLGGLLSLPLHDSVYCDSLVTVSAPIDGMSFNLFIRGVIAMRSPFLVDAFSGSKFIREMHGKTYHKHIDQVCSVNGFSPMIGESNDGVVTVRSQTKWKPQSACMHSVHCNHTEILVSDYLYEVIAKQLERPHVDPQPQYVAPQQEDHSDHGECRQHREHQALPD